MYESPDDAAIAPESVLSAVTLNIAPLLPCVRPLIVAPFRSYTPLVPAVVMPLSVTPLLKLKPSPVDDEVVKVPPV